MPTSLTRVPACYAVTCSEQTVVFPYAPWALLVTQRGIGRRSTICLERYVRVIYNRYMIMFNIVQFIINLFLMFLEVIFCSL